MANERLPDDLTRPPLAGDDLRAPVRLHQLQPDPERAEGRASGGRIAIYAVAIAVVIGAVFYGLNDSSVEQAGTTPVAATAQNDTQQPPPAPPGMRDVTPHANTQPGVTTGAAPNRPPSPSPNPSDANQAANPFNHSEQR
jgi:hypothetical protein